MRNTRSQCKQCSIQASLEHAFPAPLAISAKMVANGNRAKDKEGITAEALAVLQKKLQQEKGAKSSSSSTASTCPGSSVSGDGLSCQSCDDAISVMDSKATGRNPLLRNCNTCVNNKRTMERRTKSLGQKNPVSVHWQSCLQDKLKMHAHMRNMKRKQKNARWTEQDMVQLAEEVHTVGVEKKKRREYEDWDSFYDSRTLFLDDSEILDKWRERASHQDTQAMLLDGVMYLSKPGTTLILDEVENKHDTNRLQKQRRLETADDVADARAQETQRLKTKQSHYQALLPKPVKCPTAVMPEDDLTSTVPEVSHMVTAALSKSDLANEISQHLMSKQQNESEELAAAISRFQDKEEANRKKEEERDDCPRQIQKVITQLKTDILEKAAKLDAHILRMQQEVPAEGAVAENLGHLAEESDDKNGYMEDGNEKLQAIKDAFLNTQKRPQISKLSGVVSKKSRCQTYPLSSAHWRS